jgi:hypothetical protein
MRTLWLSPVFYMDKDGDFAAEAWWSLYYDRTAFGVFLDLYSDDVGSAIAEVLAES